jgi:ferric-dicitrate binding protein FerR (iron transport regulator)
LESRTSSSSKPAVVQTDNRLRLGAVAAVLAIAAGLATAWWYRKTLKKLRQAEETAQNPQFGIAEDDPENQA